MAHSWSWLSPRSFVQLKAQDSSRAAAASRPCLPTVETLDDRMLLSVAPSATTRLLPPDPCLLAEINGAIGQPGASDSLVIDELATIKLAGGLADNGLKLDGNQLTGEFLKINALFAGLDAALITGNALPAVQLKYDTAINAEFLKLDTIVGGSFGDGSVNLLLPAVQKIQTQALALEATLGGLGTGSGASFKTEVVYLGLDAAFTDLENNLVIAGANLAFAKMTPAPIDVFKIKLDEFFIGLLEPPDPAVQAELGAVVSEANTILANLTNPTTGGGGGGTTTAATTTAVTPGDT